MPHLLLSRRGCLAFFPVIEKRGESQCVPSFRTAKIAGMSPSPGLQKSRLLFCKHRSVLRGLLTSEEERRWAAFSDRGRGQAKVKSKGQSFGERGCPDRAGPEGTSQHWSSEFLLLPLPKGKSAQGRKSAEASLQGLDMAQWHQI